MSDTNQIDGIPTLESNNGSVTYRIYNQEQAFRHMTRARSEAQQQLYLAVDDVLFYNWDALCLSVDEDYREEYLPYLPHVFDLLMNTDDGSDIYDYLILIEDTWIDSIKFDNLAKQRASRVVEILLEHRQTILLSDGKK